jgi:hypothetical protein
MTILFAASLCFFLNAPLLLAQTGDTNFRLNWDQFHDGFSVGSAESRWFYFTYTNVGTFVANDGRVTTSPQGLRVISSGTNPATAEPMFTVTMAQEDDNPFGLPGQLDHFKWLAFANHHAASGTPGFDVAAGQELSFEAVVSGQTYGTTNQPFGTAVSDAEDDPRLAATALSVVDFDTLMEFDFFLTNRRIYAVYARQPFARSGLGNYAAFVFLIPVAERAALDDWQRLSVAFDKDANAVRWLVNNREVFRVDHPGRLIDRRYMVIDNGGTETDVIINQLDAGLGLLNLLDGGRSSGPALARLSNLPFFYFDTAVGIPTLQSFVDTTSGDSSRLFGQGAELRARNFVIASRHISSRS